jgi:aminopeptidase N
VTWRGTFATLVIVAGLGALALMVIDADRFDPPGAGIPRALAEERAARVSGVRYAVSLTVPASPAQRISGRLTATFLLQTRDRPLAFDFNQPADALTSVRVNGAFVDAAVEASHVVLSREHLVVGPNTVEFEFTAGDEALNRQEDFLYSLFVPARASLTMPLFDQPNIKARWQLTLTIPHGWTAVSNARQSGLVGTPMGTSVAFETTQPLPPYLFAFAAGRFQVESAERGGRTMRLFHRETDRGRLERNRQALFDLHARALAWLEEYTAIPYPFETFDIVLIPAFQFTGMEHPGALFYNATTLLLEPTATQSEALARASVIAHETAHMWFGNLVTMSWFDDVWMKEVFANFMAAKIVNPSFPEMDHELRFLIQHYPAAYDVDRTDGSNPIRQPLENLTEAGTLYGAIIYQKAPIVMRQLEMLAGPDVLRAGLREYLSAYRYGNATWPDLVRRLDERSPLDLDAWNRSWVTEPGRPTITTRLDAANGRISRLSLHQRDPRGRAIVWPQRLVVAVSSAGHVHEFDVMLDKADVTIEAAMGLPVPEWVLPVGLGLGYGLFELDAGTVTSLTASIQTIRSPVLRGAALVALWEWMLEDGITVDAVWTTLLAALPVEHDELNLQLELDYARTLFWRFMPPAGRESAALGFEALLRSGLQNSRTMSARAAWFRTLRSVAITPDTLGWLDSVWRRETAVPDLRLAETDETALALELALRDHPGAAARLETQQQRIANPDRRARFTFLMPSVSADPSIRKAFVERLQQVDHRRHETWVVDGLRYVHHPLRTSTSRPFVVPLLKRLPEIQRTGDIFFPQRWADATLSGYQTPEEAAEVRSFIDSLAANYPERLRWTLLSAADMLFRSAKHFEGQKAEGRGQR